MNSAMKPVWGLFFILLALLAVVGISTALQPKEKIPWRTDYAAAMEEARSMNKPVLLYFTANWCGPCQTMKRTTWADANVELAMQRYVPVKIDIDRNRETAMQYNIESIPTIVTASPNGLPDERTSGGMDSSQLLDWLKRKRD
jgi:thioredoxin 1